MRVKLLRDHSPECKRKGTDLLPWGWTDAYEDLDSSGHKSKNRRSLEPWLVVTCSRAWGPLSGIALSFDNDRVTREVTARQTARRCAEIGCGNAGGC